MKKLIISLLLLICVQFLYAQKVGLVFSGGGAKGLAHIGVLKALEENNIPIDYIVGTSMGGIVGGMYASGYSPAEIEQIALSQEFQKWVNGSYVSDYSYFYKKKPQNPSFLSAKLKIDTGFNVRLRSNLINDVPLNFALLELFGQASVNARGDFDRLFVPFRCIVADVFSQKMIPVSKGNLPEAIRGTFTVPLVYRPIKVDDKYVFDGGLYNNFPIDVIKKDFQPDYIIGTNVSSKIFNEYPSEDDERLMNRFLIYMFLSKSDSTTIGENGTYIQPDVGDYSTTNFNPVAELIQKGYESALSQIPKLKEDIKRRSSPEQLADKRSAFKSSRPPLEFGNVEATGLNTKQRVYVENVIEGPIYGAKSLEEVKKGYFKLVADESFETVYPRIRYKKETDTYNFELLVSPEKNFKVDVGAVLATRPISNAYIGLQYNYLRKKSYTFSANFYAGGFYESAQGNIRVDVPARLPFFLETEFTWNHWNYFNKSEIFIEDVRPTFIEQSDRRMVIKAGIPAGFGRVELQTGYINFYDRYSPTQTFQVGDIMDFSKFNGVITSLSYRSDKLNRKQYASAGSAVDASMTLYKGTETYTPGNILRDRPNSGLIQPEKHEHGWFKAAVKREEYFQLGNRISLGYLGELVLSDRPPFSNYTATLLTAPAFNPLQDSKSLFLANFRANNYGALGIRNVVHLRRNLDLRAEGYLFQPIEKIFLNELQSVSFGNFFANRHYAATAGLVYHTLAGPISLSFNHYDDDRKRYGVLFHMGFLIYNKRSFE